jgi:phosphohistidine phosphatase SixA
MSDFFSWRGVAIVSALTIILPFHALAQTLPAAEPAAPSAPPVAAAPAEAPRPPPPAIPLVDPARALSGKALLDALRAGGLNLYMRHAQQIPPVSAVCEGSNLTPLGDAQAQRVGKAMRELKIPVGKLYTSEPCRNIDTAKQLGLGPYEIREEINPGGTKPGVDYGALRTKMLMQVPAMGTNTLLVSHMHGSPNRSEWMHLELGEIIVYRPNGKNLSSPIARIRVEGWDELLTLAK